MLSNGIGGLLDEEMADLMMEMADLMPKSAIFLFWNTPDMGQVCFANPPLKMADFQKKNGGFVMADLPTLIPPIMSMIQR